jgi:hypothetical protein
MPSPTALIAQMVPSARGLRIVTSNVSMTIDPSE